MSSQLKIQIVVDDQGTATITNFAQKAAGAMDKVKAGSVDLGAGFAKTWAGIAAGAASALYLFDRLREVATEPIQAYMASESAVMKLGLAMKNQGMYTREALDDMIAFSEEMQRTTTVEDDLAKSVMGTMMSFGMTAAEVKRSTQAAADMAAFTGKSIETVSELLGKAYAGNTTALSRYGIVIDESIPKAEQFSAVLRQLEQRFGGAAQAEILTYAGQWKQLRNQWGDIQEFIGLVFLKTLEGLLVTVGLLATTFLTAGNAILGILRMITAPVMYLIDGMALLAEKAGMQGVAEGLRGVTSAIGEAQNSIVAAREDVLKWTSKNYDLLQATDKVGVALDQMGKAGQRTARATEESAKEMEKRLKALADQYRDTYDAAVKHAEHAAKMAELYGERETEIAGQLYAAKKAAADAWYAAQKANIEKHVTDVKARNDQLASLYRDYLAKLSDADRQREAAVQTALNKLRDITINAEDGMIKEIEEGVKTTLASIARMYEESAKAELKAAEDEKKSAKDRLDAYRDLYRDMKGYAGEHYEYTMRIIRQQAEAYRKLGIDQGVIDEWTKQESIKAWIARGKAAEDFFTGVKAGLIEMALNAKTCGQMGAEAIAEAYAGLRGTLDDAFFSLVKGDLKGFEDAWQSFADSLLRIFTKLVADLLAQWALLKVAGWLGIETGGIGVGGSGGGAGTSVAGIAANKIAGTIIEKGATAAYNYVAGLAGSALSTYAGGQYAASLGYSSLSAMAGPTYSAGAAAGTGAATGGGSAAAAGGTAAGTSGGTGLAASVGSVAGWAIPVAMLAAIATQAIREAGSRSTNRTDYSSTIAVPETWFGQGISPTWRQTMAEVPGRPELREGMPEDLMQEISRAMTLTVEKTYGWTEESLSKLPAGIGAAVRERLEATPLSILPESFRDIVKDGEILITPQTYGQVNDLLVEMSENVQNTYFGAVASVLAGMDAGLQGMAATMMDMGASAVNVASALMSVGASATEVAPVLAAMGADTRQVAAALIDADAGLTASAQALAAMNTTAVEAHDALMAADDGLKIASDGFTTSVIGGIIPSVDRLFYAFTAGTEDMQGAIAALMDENFRCIYSIEDVVTALNLQGASQEKMEAILTTLGFTVDDVTKAFQALGPHADIATRGATLMGDVLADLSGALAYSARNALDAADAYRGVVFPGIGEGERQSYAVGAWSIPHDQIAQIHKGEMIIPAREAERIRRGDGLSVDRVFVDAGREVPAVNIQIHVEKIENRQEADDLLDYIGDQLVKRVERGYYPSLFRG